MGSNPSRCEILSSLCGIASSVLRLLDLVDSLFVSKFPMRKQVYSFTEKLLELGMAYKPVERKGGREGGAIRDMRKQLPALNNSAQVVGYLAINVFDVRLFYYAIMCNTCCKYSRSSLVRTPEDRKNAFALSGIRINQYHLY